MLTQKRKLRDRKYKLQKIYFFLGLIVLGVIAAYFTSWRLFPDKGYISPLGKQVLTDNSYQDEKAIDFIRESLHKEEIKVKNIEQQDAKYIVQIENGAEIVLSAKKDVNAQISSLHFILIRLTMEGRRFSRLDLTFDKPVIVLEK